jgi:hypothetical protein
MTADAADRRAAELVRVVEAGPVTFRLHVGDESVRDLVGRSYAEAYAARLRSQIAAELRAAEARGRAGGGAGAVRGDRRVAGRRVEGGGRHGEDGRRHCDGVRDQRGGRGRTDQGGRMKTADERAAEIVRVEEDALGMCRVLYDDDPQTDGTTRGFAEAVAAQMREPIAAAINAAVAAERERCAGVAEAMAAASQVGNTYEVHGSQIAVAECNGAAWAGREIARRIREVG